MKALLLRCLVFSFLSVSSTAFAQDAGMMAAQAAQQANDMAMQAAQQANQQAMQASQQANQQAMQDMQNASMQNQFQPAAITRAPKFSAASGTLAQGSLVRMKSPTHYATIYYTTDGWTPTTASKKYTGPIRINHDTVLQAIAFSPNMLHSLITQAAYTVPGSSPVKPSALSTDGVLRSGTRLQLATDAQLDSKTAQVGDTFPLRLEQDITAGGKIVIPKDATVEAVVTHADHSGHVGEAGEITFEVHTLQSNGITIPLRGGETLEGKSHFQRARALIMIPVVGPATLLARGEEAVIKPGMALKAVVAADTPLAPTATN